MNIFLFLSYIFFICAWFRLIKVLATLGFLIVWLSLSWSQKIFFLYCCSFIWCCCQIHPLYMMECRVWTYEVDERWYSEDSASAIIYRCGQMACYLATKTKWLQRSNTSRMGAGVPAYSNNIHLGMRGYLSPLSHILSYIIIKVLAMRSAQHI